MNKFFYYHGKETTLDILNHKIIKSKKADNFLNELYNYYENFQIPVMPVSADLLIKKYKIPKGKEIGLKLKIIEKEWVENDFKITDKQINNIIKN